MRGGAVRVGGVAALGHGVVERVVAPVEAVRVAHRGHRGLLLLASPAGTTPGRPAGCCLLGAVLVDGGDVERRQQVHVRHARARPAASGACMPLRVARVKAVKVPRSFAGTRGVVDAEVAHVQLVEHDVFGRRQRAAWPACPSPCGVSAASFRSTIWLRVLLVDRLNEYGSVTQVGLDRLVLADVDLHLVEVELARPVGGAGGGPHALVCPPSW